MGIRDIIKTHPIIAAAQWENMEQAVSSKAGAVLLMHARLGDLLEQKFSQYNTKKPLFIHTDLVKGLSGDSESVNFLMHYVTPSGIVSTKGPMIRSARKAGLLTIQRIFLIDTRSLKNAVESIQENNPDAVEIMPGLVPSIIPYLRASFSQPLIMGGLITQAPQIQAAFEAGADAVSLSAAHLWNFELDHHFTKI